MKMLFLTFILFGSINAWAITPTEEPIVQAVAKAMPSVVNINTEGTQKVAVDFFQRYYVQQKVQSLGSGALISPEGYIVTCAHVVEGAANLKIKVTLSDGSEYQAKTISSDSDRDLAVIKIEDKKPFPFLDLKTLSPNLLGQTVIALGNPVGYQNSVSAGILSAKNRTFRVENHVMEGLLQTDAAINPGNSGGPLVDINGHFVGLNSAKAAGQVIEGLGFAIPGESLAPWVNDVIAIAKGLKKAPPAVKPEEILQKRFGLKLQELTPELASTLRIPVKQGIVIGEVESESPADQAQMKPGMLITSMGGAPIRALEDLPRDLVKVRSGQTVIFQITLFKARPGQVLRNTVNVPLVAR